MDQILKVDHDSTGAHLYLKQLSQEDSVYLENLCPDITLCLKLWNEKKAKMEPPDWANSSCTVNDPNENFSLIRAAANCEKTRSMFDGCRNACYYSYQPLQFNHDITVSPLIYGTIFPVLVGVCVAANIFVVLVLSQKHMISATNRVLLYMAIADLAVGVVPFPFTFWFFTLKNYETTANLSLSSCYMFQFLMDALPPICHNIAMWLTVILALQRFISIQYPVRSQGLCTIRNVKIAAIVIVLVSIVCGSPKVMDRELDFFEGWRLKFRYQEKQLETVWVWERSCIYKFSPAVLMMGLNSFYNMYFWTRAILFIMIPSVLLIVLNVLLIRGIHKAKIRKNRLLMQNRRREARRQTESNSTSIMLVIIVSVFLVVNLPQGFFLAFLCLDTTFDLEIVPLLSNFLTWFLPVDNMLIIATYPLNFAIYCFMSSQFRQTFKRLFCCGSPPISAGHSRASTIERTVFRRFSSRLQWNFMENGGRDTSTTTFGVKSATNSVPQSRKTSEKKQAKGVRRTEKEIPRVFANFDKNSATSHGQEASEPMIPKYLNRNQAETEISSLIQENSDVIQENSNLIQENSVLIQEGIEIFEDCMGVNLTGREKLANIGSWEEDDQEDESKVGTVYL